MAALSGASMRAIARLRAYVPPPSQFYNLPLSRRAAVLILLFADKSGNLKVVLTLRSTTLSSYAGQAALPGGKADTLAESAFQTARREAYEEIGLPLTGPLPGAFTVEHLCQLPTYLARTELGVRPCIALLSPLIDTAQSAGNVAATAALRSAEEILIPQLDAKEVAAVFTAPVYNFLRVNSGPETMEAGAGEEQSLQKQVEKNWYQGVWTEWYGHRWRMHNFYVPTAGKLVTRQRKGDERKNDEKLVFTRPMVNDASSAPTLPYREHKSKDDSAEIQSHFRVFGMTARIIVDAARLAYNEEPEFEHNPRFGDEDLIKRFLKMGRLGPMEKSSKNAIDRDFAAAAKI